MKVREMFNGSAAPLIAKSLEDDGHSAPIRLVAAQPLNAGATTPLPQPPDQEVNQIIQAWSRTFGLRLNADAVRNHLETLRRWEAQWRHKENSLL